MLVVQNTVSSHGFFKCSLVNRARPTEAQKITNNIIHRNIEISSARKQDLCIQLNRNKVRSLPG